VSLLAPLAHAYSRYQLCDIAKGLEYLHACNVIHGDLKGVRGCAKFQFNVLLTLSQANVLVDGSGQACIADFGLATVTQNLDSIRTPSPQHGYTPRWTAPEVLNEGKCSKEADIFSFAMVMIEVCRRRSMIYCIQCSGLLLFRTNTGVHRCGSVQKFSALQGRTGHSRRQAPFTASASNLHG